VTFMLTLLIIALTCTVYGHQTGVRWKAHSSSTESV